MERTNYYMYWTVNLDFDLCSGKDSGGEEDTESKELRHKIEGGYSTPTIAVSCLFPDGKKL